MMFRPNFVQFTDFSIAAAKPIEAFEGNQNSGFVFVEFQDGSGGIVKSLKDWHGNKTGRLYPAELLAAQEYLAARVGEVMDAPIRDCRLLNSTTVIMPYIEGKNGDQLDKDGFLDNQQGVSLRLFDHLTANADRRAKNLLFGSHDRIVGIDHALCNFRPRKMMPEPMAALWNNGISVESLTILRPKLEDLYLVFAEIGMEDKHQNLLGNLDWLLDAFTTLSQVAVIKNADLIADADGKAAEAMNLRRLEKWQSAGYAHSKAADLYRQAAAQVQGSEAISLEGKAKAQDELSREAHFTDVMGENHSPAEMTMAKAVVDEVVRVARSLTHP
jgi:hypothetical protein